VVTASKRQRSVAKNVRLGCRCRLRQWCSPGPRGGLCRLVRRQHNQSEIQMSSQPRKESFHARRQQRRGHTRLHRCNDCHHRPVADFGDYPPARTVIGEPPHRYLAETSGLMRRPSAEVTPSGQPAPIWRQGHGTDLTLVPRPGLSADAAHDGARLPIPHPDHLVFAGQNEVAPVRCEGEALDETRMPAGIELQDRCVAGAARLRTIVRQFYSIAMSART
jgi:hypothetical protein